MQDDWFDELTNGEPPLMTNEQWFIIETQIDNTSISAADKEDIYNRMNYITDPQKQWLKMLKDGVFDND